MDQSTDFYGYLPSKPAALFGVAYFGGAAIACLIQTFFGKYKHYWMLTLALAASGEAVGWGGRFWAHLEPTNWMPFMIQISSLIVSPVFISATQYILFCKMLDKTGPRFFHVSSKFYWIGFIILDIISLAIQTVGGVLVSSAEDFDQLNHGSSVMRSGIIFQFSNTVVFVMLIFGAIFRLHTQRIRLLSITGWPVMVVMSVSTVMVLVRNAYRIAELSGGWKGHLMRTESYLIALDMAPMSLAVGIFVVFSPAFFFCDNKHKEEVKKASSFDCIPLE